MALSRSFHGPVSLLLLSLTACGGPGGDGGDGGDGTTPCAGDETRCAGNVYQTCEDGFFVNAESCALECVEDLGCLECDPSSAYGCNGADVVTCNADGTFGDLVETCAEGEACDPDAGCTRSCTADGVDLIYVVDDSYNLRSFDPRLVGSGTDPFTLIGPLDCPASNTPAPGWNGNITPFSMAVDRNAVAWVLYASGEIFNVSTNDASCTATGFAPSQAGMNLFGMGFVTDEVDGDTEKLFIGGGDAAATPGGQLGVIENLTVSLRGPLRDDTEYSAELTGTGAAELFGFYPGINEAFVQEIDAATGAAVGPEYTVPGGLGGGEGAAVQAWAFAQWGGKFYLFVTTTDGLSSNSTVRTIDRTSGDAVTLLQDLPFFIVGAGVSTCAPTDID
jgi:hypothetical protein